MASTFVAIGAGVTNPLKGINIANAAGQSIWSVNPTAAYNASGTLLLDLTGSRVNLSQGFAFLNPSLAPAIVFVTQAGGSNYTLSWPTTNTAGVLTNNGSGTLSWV